MSPESVRGPKHSRITAYGSELALAPAQRLGIKVSTDAPAFGAEVLRPGLDPAGDEPVPGLCAARERYRGRLQRLHQGSCMVVDPTPKLSQLSDAGAVGLWVLATRPTCGRSQAVFSHGRGASGWWLGMDERGRPTMRLGAAPHGGVLTLSRSLPPWRWVWLASGYDNRQARAWLHSSLGQEEEAASAVREAVAGPVLLAGRVGESGEFEAHFDGRISGPLLLSSSTRLTGDEEQQALDSLLGCWDFAQVPDTDVVPDASGNELHGRLINAPTRAVRGPRWDGTVTDWRAAPEQYAAVHFHSDDLGDAAWEDDLDLELPEQMPSDLYAVRLAAELAEAGQGGDEEWVPFIVRRRAGSRNRVLVWLPTFTYLAYANDTETRPDLGLSMYDQHLDGTGVCQIDARRPLPTFSPRYVAPGTGAPRNFSLDLVLLHWLRERGIGYDVVDDHQLDVEGASLLSGYEVVLSGSHPEYVSGAELDALGLYVSHGGRLMYLGGNGCYWVTSVLGSGIEVRRGQAGSRTWESLPGEGHHQSTGEPGGLWRHRGRAPQKLLGVGFCGQGVAAAASYRRTERSYEQDWRWVFDGVADEVFGTEGLVLGGAAGDEVDSASAALGTPVQTVVLAGAELTDPGYRPPAEDVTETGNEIGATEAGMIRADLSLTPHAEGRGAVFSVGSMAWLGALWGPQRDEPVDRITANVLERFLEPDPLPCAPEAEPVPSAAEDGISEASRAMAALAEARLTAAVSGREAGSDVHAADIEST